MNDMTQQRQQQVLGQARVTPGHGGSGTHRTGQDRVGPGRTEDRTV